MTSFMLLIAIVAFLAGGANAIFLMVVIGIRKGDRTRCLPGARDTPLDSFTRSVLGTGTWPRSPAAHGDHEEN